VLESCSLPEASECINILEDMDQTLSAHDAIVMNLTPNIMNPVEQPVVSYNEGVEGNIKIIKFPESNELLVST
jgi:hypothetical protein